MRDRRFVLAGLALFLTAASYPAWRAIALGTRPEAPPLARSRVPTACVAPADEMRASHMKLLAEWRDLAVRQGVRSVTMPDARKWKVSLSGTCLVCHEKAKFCDRCHAYAAVKPDCWNCHAAQSAESTQSTGSQS